MKHRLPSLAVLRRRQLQMLGVARLWQAPHSAANPRILNFADTILMVATKQLVHQLFGPWEDHILAEAMAAM